MASYDAEMAAQEITPAMELTAIRNHHQQLTAKHKELTQLLMATLEKDCARLERQCKEMEGMLSRVRQTTDRPFHD